MSERVFGKYRKNCIDAFVEVIHLRAENVSNEVLVRKPGEIQNHHLQKVLYSTLHLRHSSPFLEKLARGKWS